MSQSILKGLKKDEMPRISKARGNKPRPRKKAKQDEEDGKPDNHYKHKVCLLAAVDSNDKMFISISGLGRESSQKLDKYSSYFKKKSTLVCDGATFFKSFCDNNDLRYDTTYLESNKTHYVTKLGNSLLSVNQLHQDISLLIKAKKGVSTRHLQGYLDFLVFKKKLFYRVEEIHRKIEAYSSICDIHSYPIHNDEISEKPFPIDLYEAYGDYKYGIFADIEANLEKTTA